MKGVLINDPRRGEFNVPGVRKAVYLDRYSAANKKIRGRLVNGEYELRIVKETERALFVEVIDMIPELTLEAITVIDPIWKNGKHEIEFEYFLVKDYHGFRENEREKRVVRVDVKVTVDTETEREIRYTENGPEKYERKITSYSAKVDEFSPKFPREWRGKKWVGLDPTNPVTETEYGEWKKVDWKREDGILTLKITVHSDGYITSATGPDTWAWSAFGTESDYYKNKPDMANREYHILSATISTEADVRVKAEITVSDHDYRGIDRLHELENIARAIENGVYEFERKETVHNYNKWTGNTTAEDVHHLIRYEATMDSGTWTVTKTARTDDNPTSHEVVAEGVTPSAIRAEIDEIKARWAAKEAAIKEKLNTLVAELERQGIEFEIKAP